MSSLKMELVERDLLERAHDRGVRLIESEDFEAFYALNGKLEDRGELTPMFHPLYSGIQRGQGFWIKGVKDGGEVVHLQAFRIDTIEAGLPGLFSDWLVPLYERAGDRPRADREGLCRSPIAARITGRVIYHGEIWIKSGLGGGLSGLGEVLPRLGILRAMQRWQVFDWMYGFITQRKAFLGVPARWGYAAAQPQALCWEVPPRDEPLDEWLCAASQADLETVIAAQLRERMLVAQTTDSQADGPRPAPAFTGTSRRR